MKERVVFKRTLIVGRTAEGRRVSVTAELTERGQERTTTGEPITRRTVDHEAITGPYLKASFCGEAGGSGGQINLREALAGGTLTVPEATVDRIVVLWDRWHLSGMHAGCRHQRHGPYDDPEIANQVCVESGYKYGSAWLLDPVPDAVVEEIKALFLDGGVRDLESELDALCIDRGVTATVARTNGPMPEGFDKGGHSYSVTLGYQGRKMVAPFHMGSGHTKPPTAGDVLGSLISDTHSVEQDPEWSDWADSLGYDLGSREGRQRAREIHARCMLQATKVRRLLGVDFDRFASVAD